MRGMLIDDDESIRRLRQNVILMHLRARRPQGIIGWHFITRQWRHTFFGKAGKRQLRSKAVLGGNGIHWRKA